MTYTIGCLCLSGNLSILICIQYWNSVVWSCSFSETDIDQNQNMHLSFGKDNFEELLNWIQIWRKQLEHILLGEIKEKIQSMITSSSPHRLCFSEPIITDVYAWGKPCGNPCVPLLVPSAWTGITSFFPPSTVPQPSLLCAEDYSLAISTALLHAKRQLTELNSVARVCGW